MVYGVWLASGLVYVEQTAQAQRRLRDLPVGESHHLASTFPPEIWARVVVIAWPRLPGAASGLEVDAQTVGLALEHRLQAELRPMANHWTRTPAGGWRELQWQRSTSRGALAAGEAIEALFEQVLRSWVTAADACPELAVADVAPGCRVVLPGKLLRSGH